MTKKIKIILASLSAMVLIPFAFSASALADEVNDSVNIPDENLRDAILDELNETSDYNITKSDMESITYLSVSNKKINSLEGLNYCLNLNNLQLQGDDISDVSQLSSLLKLERLNLSNNKLTDISPLANLQNLKYLEAYDNEISDLTSLSSLTNLQYLSLWENKISDVSTISKLTNIEELSLSRNNISNIEGLADLKSLEELTLDGNKITDISSLMDLTELTYLDLTENKVSSIKAIQSLTKLTDLYLDNNNISNISPVSNLFSLENFSVDNQSISLSKENGVSDYTIENPLVSINNMPVKEIDNISNNGIYDDESNTINWRGLGDVAKLTFSFSQYVTVGQAKGEFSGTFLEDLVNSDIVYFEDDNFKNAVLDALKKDKKYEIRRADMENLEYLDASNRNIKSIEGIQFAKNLKILQLHDNKISDIHQLGKLRQLYSVWLYRNNISSIEDLKDCTSIQVLSISYNKVDDISILKNFNNLEYLYLSTNKLTDISSVANLTKLKELSADYNNLQDVSVLKNLTNLTALNLSGTKLSDISVIKNFTNLNMLYLSSNSITDTTPLKDLNNLSVIDLKYQNICLENQKSGDLTLKNNLKLPNGQAVTAIESITSNGIYNEKSNTFQWKGIGKNMYLSLSFKQNIKVGNACGEFAGTVYVPVEIEM